MQKFEYIVSAGSNTNHAVQCINEVFELLRKKFDVVACSHIIPTRAVDMAIECLFFNAVAKIETETNPARLKLFLKTIEEKMGRIPHSDSVPIDLDIILINGNIVHKDYEERKFIRELIENLSI